MVKTYINDLHVGRITLYGLILIIFASVAFIPTTTTVDFNGKIFFYIYGDPFCPHCRSVKEYVNSTYGPDSYYFCDLRSNSSCLEKYLDLTSTIEVPEYVPVVILLNNCTVKAIIIGSVEDKDFLDNLLYSNSSGTITVYSGTTPIKKITIRDMRNFIAYYASGKTCPLTINMTPSTQNGAGVNITWEKKPGIIDVLPQLVILAFLDSINPCTMSMYALFLASRKPGKTTLLSGLLFILIIYVGYMMIALGLLAVVYLIPPWVFLVAAMMLTIYNLSRLVRKGSGPVCRECGILGKISGILSNDYLLSVFLALYSVTALLPCSAGPLFAFLSVIHDLCYMEAVLGLILYNLIFVAPLAAILVLIATMGRAKKIIGWINRNNEVVGFLSSILLLFIVFILMIQY